MNTLLVVVVVAISAACSSSTTTATGAACFSAGDHRCPNDAPFSQADVDACNRCLADYQALLRCDPNGGFTCLDGKSETSKDLTCKPQADGFETCVNHPSSDAGARD